MYFYSGAATTASRLGQPDVAIATLNDFVGVSTVAIFLTLNLTNDILLGRANGLQPAALSARYCGRRYRVSDRLTCTQPLH